MALTLHVEIDAETGQFKGAVTGAESELQRFSKQAEDAGRRSERVFGRLRSTVTGAIAPIGRLTRSVFNLRNALIVAVTAAVLRQYTRLADTWSLMQSRLKLVTTGQENLRQVTDALFNITQDARGEFAATVELYSRLARSSQQLGVTQDQLLTVTTAINQALIVSGATGAEASAGLIQFAQGLASGALRGDELRSVLEQLPRLAQAIADGLGITVGQLRQLGAEGKLSARAILDALLKEAPRIADEFQQIQRTTGQALTQLGNDFERAIGLSAEQSKATKEITAAIDDLRGVIKDPSFQQGLADLVTAIIRIGAYAGQAVAAIHDFKEGLLDLFNLRGGGVSAEKALKELIAGSHSEFSPGAAPTAAAAAPAPGPPPPDPEVVKAYDKMRQSIADVRFEAKLMATGVSEATQEAARAARAAGIVETFEEIKGSAGEVQQNILDFANAFDALKHQQGLAVLRGQVAELRFEADVLAADLPKSLEEAAQAARGAGLIETFEDITAAGRDTQHEMARLADQTKRLQELQDARRITEETTTALERYSITVAELRDHLEAGRISQVTFDRAVAQARDTLEGANKDQERLNDAARQFGFTFTSAFEDAIIGGQDLRSVFQGLLEDIERMILRLVVLEPLARAIAGGLTGGAAGGGAAGGGGGLFGFLGSLFAKEGGVVGRDRFPLKLVPANAFAGAPRFQAGGIVGGGIPAIVHRGEEILPPSHPRHINNAGGVEVNIYAPPGTRPRVNQRRGPGGQLQLDVILDEAVANAVRQPGSKTRSALSQSFGLQQPLIARA